MSTRNAEDELRATLARVGKVDSRQVGLDDDLPRVLGLDSLACLRLLAAVEKQFQVRFPDEQLASFRTLRQILEVIDSNSEEKAS